MKIPDDIYARVLDLSTKLVNATEAGDTKSYWLLYNELREYCEAQSTSGRAHPFLWESLADSTDDDRAAIDLYMKALGEAKGPEAVAYRASIQLALAERHKSMGNDRLAYKYALAANEEAKLLDDLDLRRDISEFLLNEAKQI